MNERLPWQFEECDTEGEIDLTRMQPFEHAVRGRREGGRSVLGYGHTPPLAEQDARQEAQKFDAREVLEIAPSAAYNVRACPPMPNDPKELALLREALLEWARDPMVIR